VIIAASTVYESHKASPETNKLLTSFSLIRNTKNLLSQDRDAGDIKTAHAIRFFNALMLLLSHKCMALFFNPYSNRTEMTEFLGKPWTVLARAASLYTDPFLMLSGMLTAYTLFGKLKRHGKINILKEYAARYLRIMPPLAFLITFCTFILPLLGNGPQWNLVVSHHSGICKQYWWRNLLFIHNWFGFSDMCLTHTHHVGIDTELFSIAPFMILALWKWPKKGSRAIVFLAVLSTLARYYVTYTSELSNYVFFGTR
jgi:peptidoglycan/LPS O-acetylase OafA/YrhL